MFIVVDEPPDEADDAIIELPALDANILQEIKKMGRHFLMISSSSGISDPSSRKGD